MPAFDVKELLVEDERNKGLDLPYRFGYAFEVNYNMQNSGTWAKVENGRVWSLKIVSKGAYSINLAYNKFYLPENSQLYIYNFFSKTKIWNSEGFLKFRLSDASDNNSRK